MFPSVSVTTNLVCALSRVKLFIRKVLVVTLDPDIEAALNKSLPPRPKSPDICLAPSVSKYCV